MSQAGATALQGQLQISAQHEEEFQCFLLYAVNDNLQWGASREATSTQHLGNRA